MSLKRKDVRAWLDPEDHVRLTELCDLEGIEIGQFIEQVLVPVIRSRADRAIQLADRLRKRGISRSGAENQTDQSTTE